MKLNTAWHGSKRKRKCKKKATPIIIKYNITTSLITKYNTKKITDISPRKDYDNQQPDIKCRIF